MSQSLDDTQPTRPVNLPKDATQPKPPRPVQPPPMQGSHPPNQYQEEESSGPGCIVWGIVGLFSIVLAVVVVAFSSLTGWSQGLQVAQAGATATQQSQIQTQCEFIPVAIESGSTDLLQTRLEFLLTQTPMVDCLITYVPSATAIYLNSLPTNTPTSTQTPTLTPTVEPSITPTGAPTATPTTEATDNPSGFDLDALLGEAQAQIEEQAWLDAVDTLDAIIAIDPTFRKGLVEQLLYQALTSQAQIYYRSGDRLAEAIILTDRAEEFGDVGELNYERFLAGLYLDGVRNLDLNNRRAVQLFTQIVVQQGLPNYQNSGTLLVDAYEGYGDDLAAGGDYCGAVTQYDAGLSFSQRPSIVTKRSEAAAFCSGGVSGTVTPGATVEPGAVESLPTQPPVAPIGVVDP